MANQDSSTYSSADSDIEFGCPAQGCPPPGTDPIFGCPAQGCQPPSADPVFGCPAQGCQPSSADPVFGCPAQGCHPGFANLPINAAVQSADGNSYFVTNHGVLINERTGAEVRVTAVFDGVIYLSDGRHIFQENQRPANPPSYGNRPSPLPLRTDSIVVSIADVGLYLGTTRVGTLSANTVYAVRDIQGPWVKVIDRFGHMPRGWVQSVNLRVVSN